jgi:uncharacterized protein (DUF1499 family)
MGWIAAIIGCLLLGGVLLRVDNWKRDWTTNWARTDPQADSPDLRPLELPTDPATLRQEVIAWVDGQPHWTVLEASDGRPHQLHLVRRTRVLRFPDDVHVTIEAAPRGDGSLLTAESRSRFGKGDLGQNPRNLKELIRGLRNRR